MLGGIVFIIWRSVISLPSKVIEFEEIKILAFKLFPHI